MEIFSVDRDQVVNAVVALGRVNYDFALAELYPLVDRLDIQRNVQNPRFYERLERDILRGCLMPPITLAFVLEEGEEFTNDPAQFTAYVNAHLNEGFVLDGIQRLNTLHRARENNAVQFPSGQSLFLNVILCRSVDNLLYRMITLNNGQRPMTARHQVEILATNAFQFDLGDLVLVTEKDNVRGRRGLFKRADFELAYMAFLSNSIAVDSQKLIQEKLDELLANKILERDPTHESVEFTDVMALIGHLCASNRNEAWFKVNNNLVGFASSIRYSYDALLAKTPAEFERFIDVFEEAFRAFDVSKIKLGRARRQAVSYVIGKFADVQGDDVPDLTERLTAVID